MKYQNAKDYLTRELYEQLQKQAGGRLLYVPTAGEKKSWGEVSGERVKLRKRNAMICREYAEGMSVAQLSNEWYLSIASIRKILSAGRHQPPDHYLGIDIGGTNIKYGTINIDGSLIGNSSIPTPKTEAEFLQTLYTIIDSVCTADQVLEECRVLLEHLDVDPLHFTSNHASNYLPLKGGLPEDKEKFLSMIDQALAGKIRLRKTLNRGI